MTNEEFKEWLAGEFGKHSLLNLSWKRGVVSLVYVLRMSGKDFNINMADPDEAGFGMIPSVRDTFIPSRDLARKIATIDYEEYDNDGVVVPLISVVYAKQQERIIS